MLLAIHMNFDSLFPCLLQVSGKQNADCSLPAAASPGQYWPDLSGLSVQAGHGGIARKNWDCGLAAAGEEMFRRFSLVYFLSTGQKIGSSMPPE